MDFDYYDENKPTDPEIRKTILEHRSSRTPDLPLEVDGNRYFRRQSADLRELSDAKTLADLDQATLSFQQDASSKK